MRLRLAMPLALVTALVVAAIPVTAEARPYRTVGKASDTGQYFVSPSLSRDVRRPRRLQVKVTTTPDVVVEVDYSLSCSKKSDFEFQNGGFTSASTKRRLPIPMRKPKECDVFVSASYSNFESEQTVRVDLKLRAKQYPRR